MNIILPDKTVSVLDRVAAKGGRSRFIERAVLHYVQSQGKQSLRKRFEAGYRANAEPDLEMAAEWFPLDQEAWKTLPRESTSQRTPVREGITLPVGVKFTLSSAIALAATPCHAHTVFTNLPYRASFASAVNNVKSAACACAISILSNGSR